MYEMQNIYLFLNVYVIRYLSLFLSIRTVIEMWNTGDSQYPLNRTHNISVLGGFIFSLSKKHAPSKWKAESMS